MRKFKHILIGMGRLFDFGSSYNSISRTKPYTTPQEEDFRALASDWNAVGKDIREAMEGIKFEKTSYLR